MVIGIVFRADGQGQGCYWDHFTMQSTLAQPTAIVLWPGATTVDQSLVTSLLAGVRKCLPHGELRLPGGRAEGHRVPPVLSGCKLQHSSDPGRGQEVRLRGEALL